jgi:hypothetical protein
MSRRQRVTLLAAICGSAVATIDGAIVNVALPAIERDLGGDLVGQPPSRINEPSDRR